MAEITNINKGKGTAQKIVQDALVVFRQYMDIPYIENSSDEDMKALFEAFGGKPGQTRVKTPKKLTAEQAIAFLDFSGFPLADENAKFSIADAIRLEAPEMFEEKSFKDYQKKFGKTMEMQERGASASKNITTAKTPKAANQPVAEIDYKSKIANGNITVREAFEAVLAKKLSSSNETNISGVFKALEKEGVDLNAPYFEVYTTKEFAEALDYTTNKTGSHRFKEFGAFETQLEGLVKTSKRTEPYVRLSDSGGKPGIASSEFGLTGKQLRAADPMRGTVPAESLDKIYHDALIAPAVTETDTKRGIDKPTLIDAEARDYLLYEKYTGQRVESNIGPDGLKITDFNFFTDENGQTVVEVASKQVGNKTRPEATYTGEFAEFLRNKVERAKSALPQGADPARVNLFQTNPSAVTKLWNDRIRPELEKKHRNQLPAQKGGSHSSLRKILARQLQVEFKFPRDAVKAWMGHAGAGVDAAGDILSESYVGTAPDDRIGEMTNTLIRNDALNSGANNVNTMFVNRGAGFSQQILFETPTKKVMGNVDLLKTNAVVREPTSGELEELSSAASARAVEQDIATESRRQYLSQLQSERRTATPKPMIPESFEPGEAVSSSLQNALQDNGFTVDDLDGIYDSLVKRAEPVVKAVGTAIETVEKIPGAKKALVAATVASGYQAGKAKAEELGLPSVAQEAAGVVSGASELTPFALSDIADTFSGFGVAATEEQKRIDELRRRGQTYAANRVAIEDAGMDTEPDTRLPATRRQQQADRIAREDTGFIPEPDRVPEAAPVEEQGFLSR